jgi:hypothetical protein
MGEVKHYSGCLWSLIQPQDVSKLLLRTLVYKVRRKLVLFIFSLSVNVQANCWIAVMYTIKPDLVSSFTPIRVAAKQGKFISFLVPFLHVGVRTNPTAYCKLFHGTVQLQWYRLRCPPLVFHSTTICSSASPLVCQKCEDLPLFMLEWALPNRTSTPWISVLALKVHPRWVLKPTQPWHVHSPLWYGYYPTDSRKHTEQELEIYCHIFVFVAILSVNLPK